MLKRIKLSYDSVNKMFIGPTEEDVPDESINPLFVSIEGPEYHAYSVKESTNVYGKFDYTEDTGIINVFTLVGEGIDVDQIEYELRNELLSYVVNMRNMYDKILEELEEYIFGD